MMLASTPGRKNRRHSTGLQKSNDQGRWTMRTPARLRIHTTLRLLAVPAAVTLLMGASLPAQAQFFSSNGANFSFPTNFFPLVDPIPQTLDFSGNTVVVGNVTAGSFAAMAGALFEADALKVGDGVTGIGTVTITGTGTSTLLGGTSNRRYGCGRWDRVALDSYSKHD
jgi:hypothetical protein